MGPARGGDRRAGRGRRAARPSCRRAWPSSPPRPGRPARATRKRQVERGRRQAVGRVGGEHDPLGGHAREQLDHVERKEAGDVVQHARMVGQARGQDALVADRAVSEDQHGSGVAQREVGEPVGRAAAARARRGSGSARLPLRRARRRVHLAAVEHEVLRARMQLDAARPRGEAAFALGQRALRPGPVGRTAPVGRRSPRPTRARGRWARGRRAGARGRAAGTRMRAARRRRRAGRAAGRASASARPRRGRDACGRRSPRRRPGAVCSTSVRNGASASA